jgi:cytidylate kinase
MSVITLSREAYSGGTALAEALARKTGFQLVTREDFSAIFRDYGLVSFEQFYASPLTIWERLDEFQNDYMNFLIKVTLHLGALGNCVILGRGCFAALNEYRDAFHVRVWAPQEMRIKRCMEEESIGEEEARNKVETLDKNRSSFINHCFQTSKAQMINAFDLVLNTGKIEKNETLSILQTAFDSFLKAETSEGESTADIETDSILMDTIRKVLAS